MPFPGFSGWILQIDPPAVAVSRTMLDINNPATGIQVGGTSSGTGVDFGNAMFTQFEAQEGQWGSAPADFIVPNRTITIPLGLGMGGPGTPNAASALNTLAEKVGLLQREGGWLLRQRSGGPALYADIVDAQLTVPDTWGETAGMEPGAVLTLITVPDWYGDEVALDSIPCTGYCSSVLTSGGAQAVIAGDYPARTRIIVTDTSGHNQLAAVWGTRSRYYDSSSTAALFYEAEALTPVNSAAVASLAGASGGQVVSLACPSGSQGSWITMLSTNLLAGNAPLTHIGTYEVWARVYSPNATPQLRLQWGAGSLAVPAGNTAVAVPGSGSFYLVDLGTITIMPPAVGSSEWFGAIQALTVNSGDTLDIDCLYFQPVAEDAGRLAYQYTTPVSSISPTANAGTGADNSGVGTVAWTNPGNITISGQYASATSSGAATTHYLEATNFGFSIPSGATILGIYAAITNQASVSGVTDSGVYLLKAGSVVGANHAESHAWFTGSSAEWVYGGPTDLWGTTWAVSDINNSGFGVAISAQLPTAGEVWVYNQVQITVYYQLGTGFAVSSDAVVYANENAEIRWDQIMRASPTGSVYGNVSRVTGDLARLPPSGLEGRAAQVFVKPTRGDLNSLADGGLDTFTVQAKYRPCFMFRQ